MTDKFDWECPECGNNLNSIKIRGKNYCMCQDSSLDEIQEYLDGVETMFKKLASDGGPWHIDHYEEGCYYCIGCEGRDLVHDEDCRWVNLEDFIYETTK